MPGRDSVHSNLSSCAKRKRFINWQAATAYRYIESWRKAQTLALGSTIITLWHAVIFSYFAPDRSIQVGCRTRVYVNPVRAMALRNQTHLSEYHWWHYVTKRVINNSISTQCGCRIAIQTWCTPPLNIHRTVLSEAEEWGKAKPVNE